MFSSAMFHKIVIAVHYNITTIMINLIASLEIEPANKNITLSFGFAIVG